MKFQENLKSEIRWQAYILMIETLYVGTPSDLVRKRDHYRSFTTLREILWHRVALCFWIRVYIYKYA